MLKKSILFLFLERTWSYLFKDKVCIKNSIEELGNKENDKMTYQDKNNNLFAIEMIKAFLGIVIIVILGYFLWEIRKIFFYLICAIILSIIGTPIVKFLNEKLKLPVSLSAIVAIILFMLIFLGILGIIIPTIINQAKDLSLLNTAGFRETINKQYLLLNCWLQNYGINILSNINKVELLSRIDYSILPEYLNAFITTIGSFFINASSILFLTFFLIKDRIFFSNLLFCFFPESKREKYKDTGTKIKSLLRRYFFGLSLQITIMLILYMSILLLFGIKKSLVIAFLCALLNIIPYLGPLVGALVFSLLSMSSLIQEGANFQEDLIPKIIRIMLFYILIQVIDNFFNQPIIYSKSVKSHPVEIFLVILIGGILFNISGMIFAVPIYTVIRVGLWEFFKEYKWTQELFKVKDNRNTI